MCESQWQTHKQLSSIKFTWNVQMYGNDTILYYNFSNVTYVGDINDNRTLDEWSKDIDEGIANGSIKMRYIVA